MQWRYINKSGRKQLSYITRTVLFSILLVGIFITVLFLILFNMDSSANMLAVYSWTLLGGFAFIMAACLLFVKAQEKEFIIYLMQNGRLFRAHFKGWAQSTDIHVQILDPALAHPDYPLPLTYSSTAADSGQYLYGDSMAGVIPYEVYTDLESKGLIPYARYDVTGLADHTGWYPERLIVGDPATTTPFQPGRQAQANTLFSDGRSAQVSVNADPIQLGRLELILSVSDIRETARAYKVRCRYARVNRSGRLLSPRRRTLTISKEYDQVGSLIQALSELRAPQQGAVTLAR